MTVFTVLVGVKAKVREPLTVTNWTRVKAAAGKCDWFLFVVVWIPHIKLCASSSGSPYRDEITLGILQLQESNRLEILKRRWWEGGQCPKEEDHRAKGGCVYFCVLCPWVSPAPQKKNSSSLDWSREGTRKTTRLLSFLFVLLTHWRSCSCNTRLMELWSQSCSETNQTFFFLIHGELVNFTFFVQRCSFELQDKTSCFHSKYDLWHVEHTLQVCIHFYV